VLLHQNSGWLAITVSPNVLFSFPSVGRSQQTGRKTIEKAVFTLGFEPPPFKRDLGSEDFDQFLN
jgi:hypothetical protein